MKRLMIFDRNLLLMLAIIGGIFFPQLSSDIAPYTFWFLAIVMMFSLSGLSIKSLLPIKTVIKPMLMGVFLNHILFGVILLAIAALFFDVNSPIFIGFVVIAATPPGVAIIPFAVKLKANLNNAIIGTFSAFMASVILAPIIIELFAGNAGVDSLELFKVMVLLIVVPFILSRLLRNDKVIATVEKNRGVVIDIGFSLIIYASIGINNHVFFTDFDVLAKIILILILTIIVIGGLMGFVLRKRNSYSDNITNRLLFSIKSSGFAVVTAMELFGGDAAIPATVMSVFVLLYFFSLLFEKKMIDK